MLVFRQRYTMDRNSVVQVCSVPIEAISCVVDAEGQCAEGLTLRGRNPQWRTFRDRFCHFPSGVRLNPEAPIPKTINSDQYSAAANLILAIHQVLTNGGFDESKSNGP